MERRKPGGQTDLRGSVMCGVRQDGAMGGQAAATNERKMTRQCRRSVEDEAEADDEEEEEEEDEDDEEDDDLSQDHGKRF